MQVVVSSTAAASQVAASGQPWESAATLNGFLTFTLLFAKLYALYDIPHTRVQRNAAGYDASGLKWRETGTAKPEGKQLYNEKLRKALQEYKFTRKEWEENIGKPYTPDSPKVVKVGTSYFKLVHISDESTEFPHFIVQNNCGDDIRVAQTGVDIEMGYRNKDRDRRSMENP